MKLSLTLIFLTTFCIIADDAFSQARQIATQPQTLAIESFNHSKIMQPNQAGGCSYTMFVKTSCRSPDFTRDTVMLAFGDAYGNKAYVQRLDDPASGRFNQCSLDAITIESDVCVQQICTFALNRSGSDGWMPESVIISGINSDPVRIVYNIFLPEGTWSGVNQC